MPYDAVPDPSRFNRGAWAINEGLFRGIIYPLSFGYNVIVPKPVRSGISKAGHNLTYPVRLVNSCLQGKWRGAWEETKRFGVNSTVGLAGFFDPATHWKIGRSIGGFRSDSRVLRFRSGVLPDDSDHRSSNAAMPWSTIVDWPLDIWFWIGAPIRMNSGGKPSSQALVPAA
jgi:hypothetical protein